MSGTVYGYIRVSSKDQHTDRQRSALLVYGIPPHCLFTDRQSGKDFNRPQYKKLLRTLKQEDCIVITSYLENIFMGKRHPLANHEKITAEEINKETFAWLSPKDYPEEYDKMRKSWQTVGIAPEKIVFHNKEGELFGAILYQI